MNERDAFTMMLNNVDEKLNGKENEKDESISEAATENNDTSEKKTQA